MKIIIKEDKVYDERIIKVYSDCNTLLLSKNVCDTIDEYLSELPETMTFKEVLEEERTFLITEL